ncbi:MAG: hypothetical protein PWQ73_731 [Petrotoga sp.]|nr:hypothetical protein [Petrotoga sp.]
MVDKSVEPYSPFPYGWEVRSKGPKVPSLEGWGAGLRGGAASKMFSLAGESPVLAICPFQPSRYIRHTER